MTRRSRTQDDLRTASNHLQYEIWMFSELPELLRTAEALPAVHRNALVESFAIHIRDLIGFFYAGTSPHGDDIIAEDFFPEPDIWRNAIPAKSDYLEELRIRANKEVAHLTYTRLQLTPDNGRWDYDRAFEVLNEIIATFRSIVPEEHINQKWPG